MEENDFVLTVVVEFFKEFFNFLLANPYAFPLVLMSLLLGWCIWLLATR